MRSRSPITGFVVALALGWMPSSASALVTISSNTIVSEADASLENQDVIVDGATLTIDGAHTLASLQVVNGGVVTHTTGSASGVDVVAQTITIDASSAIDVSGKGNLGSGISTQAGGSYGGRGGGPSIPVYGSFEEPSDLGSGGGCQSGGYSRGGGAIRLQVQDLSIDGAIIADGQNPLRCSGGSGGSIWLIAASISGTGMVRAKGSNADAVGAGSAYHPGGGGGGRIALYYDALGSFDRATQITVSGGAGAQGGGAGVAGSVVLKQNAAALITLVTSSIASEDAESVKASLLSGPLEGADYRIEVGTGYLAASADAFTLSGLTWTLNGAIDVASLTLLDGAVVTHGAGDIAGVNVIAQTITIDASSAIDVSGKGNLGSVISTQAGGSYGGRGGGASIPTYGSLTEPVDLGTGGGCQSGSYTTRGGGAIRLRAQGLSLEGTIRADGERSLFRCAGPSGGSVWLDLGTISGTGMVQAKGSNADAFGAGSAYRPGGGGGGRIAVYYDVLSGFDSASQIAVDGGLGSQGGPPGEPGTIYLVDGQAPTRILASNPADGAIVASAVTAINLIFKNKIDPATFDTSDATLSATGGAVLLDSILQITPYEYQIVLTEALPDDSYQLAVGPDIRIPAGFQMDQDSDGIDGEAIDDQYVIAFAVDNSPPAPVTVSGYAVAPAINQTNQTSVTISGNRPEPASVWLNGSEVVAYGSGSFTIQNVSLSEGSNQLDLVAKDEAGNASTGVTLLFTVDSIAPAITAISPSGYVTAAPSSVVVSVTETGSGLDAGGTSLALARDGTGIPGSVTVGADRVIFNPSLAVLQGAYALSGSIADTAGNVTPVAHNFVVDYTPPAAPGVDPVPAVVNNSSLTLTGSKEANTAIRIDGVEVVANNGFTTWSAVVTLAQGDNTLLVSAVDLAGNVSDTTTIQVRFDDTPPGPVTLSAPILDGNGVTLTLRWPTYNEPANGGDIESYRVYREAATFSSVDGLTPILTIPAGTYEALVTDHARGTAQFYAVVAVDAHGLFESGVTAAGYTPVDVVAPEEIANLQVNVAATQLGVAWTPSADSEGDLAGYRIYVTDGGATTDTTLTVAEVGAADPVTHLVTGLDPATAYPIRVAAFDGDGNETAGLTDPGVTFITHPTALQVTPYSGQVVLSWTASATPALVREYRIYAETADYTSVTGLPVRRVVPAGTASSALAGLTDGTTYYFTVTAVNLSGGEDPQVLTVSATPQADTEGPVIESVDWTERTTTVPLEGAILTADGQVTLTATDQAGLGRAELLVDGALAATDANATNGYALPLHLFDLADGPHTLTVVVYDALENDTSELHNVTVALGAPDAPVITGPAADLTTNEAIQNVSGRGPADTEITLYNNDVAVATALPLAALNQFTRAITLAEGTNVIEAEARYPGRGAASPRSAPRTLTLDTTLPDPPVNLTAIAGELGEITLRWQAVDNPDDPVQVAGFNLYRAAGAFENIADVDVSKLNGGLIATTTFADLPIPDDTYYYAVTAVSRAGNESAQSNLASATADSAPPSATVEYTPYGNFDSESGRMAPGPVDVRVIFSEPLQAAPYLALVPNGGLPAPIALTKSSEGTPEAPVYVGQYLIEPTTPSGTAYVVMSAHDLAGNRGTEVTAGAFIEIDAHGPEVAALQLNPPEPINNDPDAQNQGRTVEVYLSLNDDVAVGSAPLLVPMIAGEAIPPYDAGVGIGVDLVQDLQQSSDGAPFLVGSFQLPISAGQNESGTPNVELLTFAWQAVDDLGNESTTIAGPNQFQVYQGDLPPLAVPFGLSATAAAGGRITLGWESVTDASAYRLYRKDPGSTEFSLIAEIPGADPQEFLDGDSAALADGAYQYSVTSVRRENGQEGESARSDPVSVSADGTAPGMPTTLALELRSYGIHAAWSAPAIDAGGNPETATLRYRLYRLGLDEGQGENVDLTGITPILDEIAATETVDQNPSQSDHMYAVTALDEAGNESLPSTGQYLNFGLLPVGNLNVDLPEDGLPVLSWQHAGTAISGFDVYEVAGSATQLNAGLITEQNFTDNSYNGGNPVSGAPAARAYRVIAVDENSVESLAHDVLLPALSVSLETGQTLRRGVMNLLQFRVDNLGAATAEGVTLLVDVDDDGTPRNHQSAPFDVPAAGFAQVPVVVGGYPGLPDQAELVLTIRQAPNPGDEVRIHQHADAAVGDAAILATLGTEDFTRGATGTARLRIENTSDVEIEVVTASNNGKQNSGEVRLQLLDGDDNVLSVAGVRQAVGSGIVTLTSGISVARIAPHSVWESAPITVAVPSAAPDDVTLRAEIDAFHYHLGRATQVSMPGTGAGRDLTLTETPYYGQLDSIAPTSIFGDQTVTLRGRALDRDTAQPLPFVPLTAVLSVEGYETSYTVYPNENGEFVFQYSPSGRTGVYTVSILHPAIHDRPNHGQFTVAGAGVSPTTLNLQIPRNFNKTVDIKVTAGAATTLTNTHLEFVSDGAGGTTLPAGLSAMPGAPLSLTEKGSGYLHLTMTGDNSAPASGQLRFDVVADEAADPVDTFVLNYTLVDVGPALYPTPTLLETGVARDSAVVERVTFKNSGLDVLHNGTLALVDPGAGTVPGWIRLLTLPELGDVEIGGAVDVDVSFAPDTSVAEANYLYELQVSGDNMDTVALPIFVAVTQSGVGAAFFHASDIYTATLDENGVPVPGLAGAKVKIQNELVYSEVYDGTTDANGELSFTDIPAGRYTYRATAFDHQSAAGRVTVKPGITAAEEVFLFNQLVSVSFSVKEITLEDRYDIRLDATFETDVPVAVVMLEPLHVSLPSMQKGDVFYGELQLTNYGLIRAYNVTGELPADTALAGFELLSEVPDSLEAGESILLPYRVIALADFEPGLAGDSTGGGCPSSAQAFVVTSACKCTNGIVVEGLARARFDFISDACTPNDIPTTVFGAATQTTVTGVIFGNPSPLPGPIGGGSNQQCSGMGDTTSTGDDAELYGIEGSCQ